MSVAPWSSSRSLARQQLDHKSVSIAFAIGDPWTARVLRECHEDAVDDALGYLQREACR
jgi:hypothetical protein